MGFTKLDEGILQSSIMAENAKVFKVWIGLLASCKEDGIARVSSVFLASACHLPLKDIDHALEVLQAPDPRSRSLNDDGRRIQRVDGGYFVINYQKYREFSYSDHPDAVRKREYRERVKEGQGRDTLGHVPFCPGHSASASASSSASYKGKNARKGIRLVLDEEPKRWEGITDEDKALWATTYPGCNIEQVLQEMIAFWDAQPRERLKINWKRAIVNRLKWIQDHGGTDRGRMNTKPSNVDIVKDWATSRGIR